MFHRLNYILWIQDIVHAHDDVLGNPRRLVRGIDMYAYARPMKNPLRKELMTRLTEERDQLLYILCLDAN